MYTKEQSTDLLQISEDKFETEKKEKGATIDFKMISFSLAGKDYAIDIMKVKEIAKAGRFTYVPNTASYVIGVYNLRGDIIPIIDLRVFFNIEVPERTTNDVENMIVVSLEERVFGIVVDDIDKVIGIEKKTIQPPHPLFADINIKYIYGIVESDNRLFILLDIESVFGIKKTAGFEQEEEPVLESTNEIEKNDLNKEMLQETQSSTQEKKIEGVQKKEEAMPFLQTKSTDTIIKSPQTSRARDEFEKPDDVEYTFIVDALQSIAGFYVSEINEQWVQRRYKEWIDNNDKTNIQITTLEHANEFLLPFYSQHTGELWQDEFSNEIMQLLPDNSAKQINVWNPGCGNGFESYSLACVLHERYPDAKVRIYAQDFDILSISNAPLITVNKDEIPSLLEPYMTKTVKGTYAFSQKIKESIQFEYHDCTHNNTHPTVDIIFMRDFLSFIPPEKTEGLYTDIEDNLKGNGTIIVGEHETMFNPSSWMENSSDRLTLYSKI